jgi:hypothetical protein
MKLTYNFNKSLYSVSEELHILYLSPNIITVCCVGGSVYVATYTEPTTQHTVVQV